MPIFHNVAQYSAAYDRRKLGIATKFIELLGRELQIFNCFVEGVVEKIRATYELPISPDGLALRAALRASLEINR